MEPLRPSDPRAVGPWQLQSRIGSGGMGVVFLAQRGTQLAALKVVRDSYLDTFDARARFKREVNVLRQVHGRFVAAIIEADMDADPVWIASEFVAGVDLKAHVEAHGAFEPAQWELLASGLMLALAAVHAAKVVHRDIKPANILLSRDGPKLIDFGIAHTGDDTVRTTTGVAIGSPAWMAPEQVEAKVVGPAADVFCAGSVLLFAATGRAPWGSGSIAEVMGQIAVAEPDLSGLTAWQRKWLRGLLEKDPARRPGAAQAAQLLTDTTWDEATQVVAAGWGGAGIKDHALGKYSGDLTNGIANGEGTWTSPGGGKHSGESKDGGATHKGKSAKPRWKELFFYLLPFGPYLVMVLFIAVVTFWILVAVNTAPPPPPATSASPTSSAGPAGVATAVPTGVPIVVPVASTDWREIRRLYGHKDNVNSIAFSSDGRWLASASRDGTVRLYEDGVAELRVLVLEPAALWCVAFSPDGRVLAIGSEDGSVKLINSASGYELHTLSGHTGPVYSVAFSLDGKSLATASKDTTVKLWDTTNGIELKTLKVHSDAVYSVAFSPDGNMLASGSADGSVGVWYLLPSFDRRSMYKHADIVYSVAFSPDSGVLASGARDNTIMLQPLTGGNEPLTLSGHADFVRSLAYSPDGTMVATGSGDKSVILWDAATGQSRQKLAGHKAMVRSVAFRPDGLILAAASEDRSIILWEHTP